MNAEKEKLRKKLKAERLSISPQQVRESSRLITASLIEAVDWPKINKAHIYTPVPVWNEIDTTDIKDTILKRWPHIKITSLPAKKVQPLSYQQFDLIIIPVLGFDKQLYRLGNGGGWYDRFLKTQPSALKVGLAHEFGYISSNVPHEPHDVPLKLMITEERIFNF